MAKKNKRSAPNPPKRKKHIRQNKERSSTNGTNVSGDDSPVAHSPVYSHSQSPDVDSPNSNLAADGENIKQESAPQRAFLPRKIPLPPIETEQHINQLKAEATMFMYLCHAFPKQLQEFNDKVRVSIVRIFGLDQPQDYDIGKETIQMFMSNITAARWTLVNSIKRFIQAYKPGEIVGTKKAYFKQIIQNGRFARKNQVDSSDLFGGTLFLECFSKTLCIPHGNDKKPKLTVAQINKESISLIFCIMLLKLTIASGDDTTVHFSSSDENDYYLLYMELVAQSPPPGTLASRINWENAVGTVRRYVEKQQEESKPRKVSNLNKLFQLT